MPSSGQQREQRHENPQLALEALGTDRDPELFPFWKKLSEDVSLPPEQGAGVVRGLARSKHPDGPALARAMMSRGNNWLEAVLTAGSAADDFQDDLVEMPTTVKDALAIASDETRPARLRALGLLRAEHDAAGQTLAGQLRRAPPGEVRWAALTVLRHQCEPHELVEVLGSSLPGVQAEAARTIVWGTADSRDRTAALCQALLPGVEDAQSPAAKFPGLLLLGGICFDRKGELDRARKLYERALAGGRLSGAGDPFSPVGEALARLVRLDYLTGRLDAARRRLDALKGMADPGRLHPDLDNQSHLDGSDLPGTLEKELNAPFRAAATVAGGQLRLSLTNTTKERWVIDMGEAPSVKGGYPGYLTAFFEGKSVAYASHRPGNERLTLAPGATLTFTEKVKLPRPAKGRLDVVFDVKARSQSGTVFDFRMQAMTLMR